MAEARTEQASPERLARARARGDVAVSRMLTAGAALCAFLAVASTQRASVVSAWRSALVAALTAPNSQFDPALALAAAARLASMTLLPPLLAAAAAAALAGVLQTGGLLAPAALRGSLDPSGRLRALLDPARVLDAFSKSIAVLILLAVALYTLAPSLPGLFALPGAGLGRALERLAALFWTLVARLGLTALALGLIDAALQRVRQQRRLRMSRRELREEQREQYGDPQVRAERLRRARRGWSARGGS